MEPLEPRCLCLREGDLAILEKKPGCPDVPVVPPELVELIEPSRCLAVGSVMLIISKRPHGFVPPDLDCRITARLILGPKGNSVWCG